MRRCNRQAFPGLGLLLACAALYATGCATPGPSSFLQGTLVIENVTVIDAVHGERPGMTVAIEDRRIVSVTPAGEHLPSPDAMRVDGTGRYLVPGLWDSHVHLTPDPGLAKSMFPLLLANGITSVRDTGGQLQPVLAVRDAAEARPTHAPRVMISGPLIDGEPAVYVGAGPTNPDISVVVTDVETAEALVDELAAAGVDLVKPYEMLQPPVFRAVVARAKKLGLRVTGHVPLALSAAEGSLAGLDSIEHLRNLELGCTDSEQAMIAERVRMLENPDDLPGRVLRTRAHNAHRYRASLAIDWQRCLELLDLHRRNGTRHVPTMALIEAVYEKTHLEPEWRQTFEDLPPEVAEIWVKGSDAMGGLFLDDPDGDAGRAAYVSWARRVLAELAGDGMLMAGTDTPIFSMTPGFSLHRELQALVTAGLTPLQALEAATLTPARYFGLEGQMGSIAEGMAADLVLVSASPLEDIRNTRAIVAVVRDGYLHGRDALDALRRQSRNALQAP